MTADFSKLLAHPDKEEIFDKLTRGIKPKDISDWLKLKYPNRDQSHLRLSAKLLKDFTDNNMDLYNVLKSDIIDTKAGKKQDKKIAESLLNNKTYRERLNELADTEIDIKRVITEIVFLIRERIEQYFDRMQENPNNLKPDYGLIRWFEVLLNAVEKFDKIINNAPDQIIQHNVTMQAVSNHTALFQDVIREVLAEMDPEASFLFMERLRERMELLEPLEEMKPLSQDKRLAEAKIIQKKVDGIDKDEDSDEDDDEKKTGSDDE
jgi:hypothetical protein